jgi:hypothetical protein
LPAKNFSTKKIHNMFGIKSRYFTLLQRRSRNIFSQPKPIA